MNEGKLVYEKTGNIGRIVFDNPTALNALTAQMWSDLGSVCREIAKDKSVRVVTLRGAGHKAFLSGTDIGGFLKFASGRDGVAYEGRMDEYIGTVETLPQPTLAIVEGWAVGGGLALSCASDFRIATPSARFGSPLGRTIGNCLSAKGYARVLAHVGVAQAKRMLLLGEMISAEEMMNLGLLHSVVEPEAIDDAAEALCAKLAAQAPLTVKASKEAMRRLSYRALPDMDDLIEMVYGSDDFKNGVRNFLEKKKTDWTGS
ncbi:MAG: enoyl-CoA hydratase/isomerase family protein [Amphiplicatus sp.]